MLLSARSLLSKGSIKDVARDGPCARDCAHGNQLLKTVLLLNGFSNKSMSNRNIVLRSYALTLVVAWGLHALLFGELARRCLACRAQRGPLGVLPSAKRPMRQRRAT